MAAEIRTPVGDAPILPVLLLMTGGYLAWFGVHYWRSNVKWPSDPIKAALGGNPLPTNTADNTRASIIGASFSSPSVSVGSVYPPNDGGSGSSAPSGGVYSHAALESLWIQAGGNPATANVAAAVAQAESSGRPGVTSKNPDGGTNVGLWQLDTKGVGAGHTITDLSNPLTNARITVMGSVNGTNWRYWETYVNGSYKKYLSGGGLSA